jgi:hypothetical protein
MPNTDAPKRGGLEHRTNRADVEKAFERYKALTGDQAATLDIPRSRFQDYILRGRQNHLSGRYPTAKTAYLAISQYCDKLEQEIVK